MLSLIKEGLKCSGFAYEDSLKSLEKVQSNFSAFKRIFAFSFFLFLSPPEVNEQSFVANKRIEKGKVDNTRVYIYTHIHFLLISLKLRK